MYLEVVERDGEGRERLDVDLGEAHLVKVRDRVRVRMRVRVGVRAGVRVRVRVSF